MNGNAAAVFGTIRYADEHELTIPEITQRTGLRWRQVSAALRDLRAGGIVIRHGREGERSYSLAHFASGHGRQVRAACYSRSGR